MDPTLSTADMHIKCQKEKSKLHLRRLIAPNSFSEKLILQVGKAPNRNVALWVLKVNLNLQVQRDTRPYPLIILLLLDLFHLIKQLAGTKLELC